MTPPAHFRLFEWVMASAMTALGVHLALVPDSISASRFYYVASAITQRDLMFVCLIVGLARIFTLATSGKWLPWCARIRGLGSAVAAIVWLQFGLALVLNPVGASSPGIPIYICLAVGEIISVWRTRREAHGH